jgi:holin-like protein
MLRPLTLLIACQFAGEAATRAAALPLPGPVLGLLILLAILTLRGGPDEAMRETAGALLRHFTLLFVPAGVAIMTQLDVLGANLVPVGCAVVVSTALGLAVTGWVMQRLAGGGAP